MKSHKKYGDYTLEKIKALVKENDNISAWHLIQLAMYLLELLINSKIRSMVLMILLLDMIITLYEQVSQGKKISFEKRLLTTYS